MKLQIASVFTLSLLLLTGPSGAQSGADSLNADADAIWNQLETAATKNFDGQEKQAHQHWQDYQKRILQKWSDGIIPAKKTFVEYSDNDQSRVRVDYENGIVQTEVLVENSATPEVAKQKISKALTAVVDESNAMDAIVKAEELTEIQGNTKAAIKKLTEDLEAGAPVQGADGQLRKVYSITFKLQSDSIKKRALKLRPLVEEWSRKYNLDPAFVLAIIRQESAFNPRARSWVPAYGLMQIVPKYAGQEVMLVVTGKNIMPDSDFLYAPDKNIMIGTTYLKLLRDQYFQEIKDEKKRQYLVTCSYNWGPNRIKKAINKGQLNPRASATELFQKLQQISPAETSDYLRKVTRYTTEFKGED
jgi:membrane-bound lytic murein transglycosylase C